MTKLALLASVLLLSFASARAEEPAADVLTLGDIHISVEFVTKVEKAWIAEQKAADPNFVLTDLNSFRREIALKQLEVILTERYVKEHKLPFDAAEAEKRLEAFKQSLLSQGITYERYLTCMARTDEEFRQANANLVAIEDYFAKDVKETDIDQVLKDRARQIPYRRCSHILYMYKVDAESTATRSKEEARKLIEEALEKVKAGTDFEKLAKEVSECPSRVVGGDLEWNAQDGQLVKIFSDALYKMGKVGDISPIIETEYGFHIIKLTGLRTDADFRGPIKENLIQEKVEAFLQQMREENVQKLVWNETFVGRLPGSAPQEPAGKTEPAPVEAKTAPAPAPTPDAKTE